MNQTLVPYTHEGKPTELQVDQNGMLYVNKKVAGRRYRFSTGFRKDEYFKAKAYANRELQERMGGKRKVRTITLITDELDCYFKVKMSEGLKPDTVKNVRNGIKQIRPYWGNMLPSEITADTMPGWYLWFIDAYPDQQMENAIKYMRNFCRYLSRKVIDGAALLPAVPAIRDPNHKKVRRDRKRRKERIFTADEFEKIFKTARGFQEQVLCTVMYTMATRVTETLQLNFGEDIRLDLSPPVYQWRDGQNKADHDGHHALHPELVPLLVRLKKERALQGTARLFPQERDSSKGLQEQQIDWEEWRSRANLGWHWTSHTFRHTCLSNLFNDESFPQALICKLYRVSLAVALETYVKPTLGGILKMQSAIKVKINV